MNIQATIVIVNYNGNHHLAPLLQHLAQQTCDDFELVFIDNGSTDNSISTIKLLRRKYGLRFQLIQNQHNVGFAPACNQGIAATKSPYVIMLNNDTKPETQWLEALLVAAQSEANVGMIASKMLFAHAPEQINSAGIAMDWTGIAWDWRGGERDDPDETEVCEIFGPCGGAALYSKKMLDEIGGFDDDFFAYMEDVDLAWRGRLAGWRCLFQPKARVYHVHSATASRNLSYKHFLLGRNKIWLIIKNYPTQQLINYLLLIVGYDLMAILYGIVRYGNWSLLKGRIAGLSNLPRFWRKRQEIQNQWKNVENWRRFIHPVVAPHKVSARYAHLDH